MWSICTNGLIHSSWTLTGRPPQNTSSICPGSFTNASNKHHAENGEERTAIEENTCSNVQQPAPLQPREHQISFGQLEGTLVLVNHVALVCEAWKRRIWVQNILYQTIHFRRPLIFTFVDGRFHSSNVEKFHLSWLPEFPKGSTAVVGSNFSDALIFETFVKQIPTTGCSHHVFLQPPFSNLKNDSIEAADVKQVQSDLFGHCIFLP